MTDEDAELLESFYAEMAADEQREAKAREWSEALLCDIGLDEPADPLYSATPYAMLPVTV